MTSELWNRVDELFRAALALVPGARLDYLARASRDAPEAVGEVRRLLEHDQAAERDWPDLALDDPTDDVNGVASDDELPTMSVSLLVVDGPHEGESFTFRDHDMFIVGRSEHAHFRLPIKDRTLSRFQFLVEINPPSCRVMDMASTNGTRVNGTRITSADLKDGDVIRGGRTTFAVSIENAPQASAPEISEDSLVDLIQQGVPAAPAFPDVPGYRIERRLGEGGMGVVCAALAPDGSRVAIKMITPAVTGSGHAVARFLREASILRQLEHPNIVRFHAIGQAGGRLFFVMDYVAGTDAHAMVKKRGPQPVGPSVRVVLAILDALHYAHSRGFVHRDVKPSNILLARSEGLIEAKLADFGLARLYHDSPLSGLTLTGHVAGTVGFMPPEQITDFRNAKPSADQYAAAASLYYLLTGSQVYDFPPTAQGQLVAILTTEPVPIRTRRPDIPEALAAVIHRALARDPGARFPDVDALGAALASFRHA